MKNMKSYFLLVTLLLIVVVNVTFQLHSHKDYLEDLLLENVEALANIEITQGECVGNGSVDFPIGNIKEYFLINGYNF